MFTFPSLYVTSNKLICVLLFCKSFLDLRKRISKPIIRLSKAEPSSSGGSAKQWLRTSGIRGSPSFNVLMLVFSVGVSMCVRVCVYVNACSRIEVKNLNVCIYIYIQKRDRERGPDVSAVCAEVFI